jgi:hypothetical protein
LVIITTVGPYGRLGEPAFRACAENGTHYLDVTGEVPFVARMIRKYEATAKSTGALMFPQIGIESAPPDLITWSLASFIRSTYSSPIADVVLSIYKLQSDLPLLSPNSLQPKPSANPPASAAPSGGTISSALSLLENFSLSEVRSAYAPYALSPIPPSPHQQSHPPKPSFLTRLTGVVTIPHLGLQTTSMAGGTDAAYIQRTWGLLSSLPSRSQQSYGPKFTFREYMRPRGGSWFSGVTTHLFLMFLGVVMATPFLRSLAKKLVGTQPGEGPADEVAKGDVLEYRAVATRDGGSGETVLSRAAWKGSAYYCKSPALLCL